MSKAPRQTSHRAALVKLAAVLLLGVAAGVGMFIATLRSTPDATETIRTTALADLRGLLDQHNLGFDPSSLRGRYVLVYFGFSFCPDACPTALYNLTLALAQLDPEAKHIQPVFVSVDPARDTPAQLRQYLAHFSRTIIGLTGEMPAIQAAEQSMGVIAVEHRDATLPGGYTMDHSNEFLLFSPAGKLLLRMPADQNATVLQEQLRGLTRAQAV